MDENTNQTPIEPESTGGSKNTLPTLVSLLVLAVIVGVTLYLYIQNKTSKTSSKTSPKQESTKTAGDKTVPKNYVPTTTEEKKMAENLQKYGVVCRRFTSVEEALKTPEIACVLDLSNQKLTKLPENIAKLTNLTEINLSNNKITTFPTDLLNIKTLISLNLGNNNISSIPTNTVIPSTIQNLNLTGNNLSSTDMEKYQRTPGTPPPTPTQNKK